MIIYNIEQIKALDWRGHLAAMMRALREELIDFANGHTVVPMPFHLSVPEVQGDCHIKGGYNKKGSVFVIKMATGFYANTKLGLPSADGLFLVCCKQTGMIQSILCDAGYLTTMRTALIACIAADLTPGCHQQVSIIGTGELACLVLEMMQQCYPGARFSLWGRNKKRLAQLQASYPFINTESELSALVQRGGLVVSTTASTSALIFAKDIREPVHFIALGADQLGKQELDESVFARAEQIIVDSKAQSLVYGDSAHAVKKNLIQSTALLELGSVLQAPQVLNKEAQVSITDLIGIAPQDLAIANYFGSLLSKLRPVELS